MDNIESDIDFESMTLKEAYHKFGHTSYLEDLSDELGLSMDDQDRLQIYVENVGDTYCQNMTVSECLSGIELIGVYSNYQEYVENILGSVPGIISSHVDWKSAAEDLANKANTLIEYTRKEIRIYYIR